MRVELASPAWFTGAMEYTDVSPEEFDQLEGLDDWRVVLDAIHATFRAPTYLAAAELVQEIARDRRGCRTPSRCRAAVSGPCPREAA